MNPQPAIRWRSAGAVEFFESDQYAGDGKTGRIVTIRAADGNPHHWLTIPADQLAATGWELAATGWELAADLLGREIRRLHLSVNARLRHRGAGRASLEMDRYRLAGLVEAHMIVTGRWKGSGEPMTLVEAYGVETFGISLAALAVAIDTTGR